MLWILLVAGVVAILFVAIEIFGTLVGISDWSDVLAIGKKAIIYIVLGVVGYLGLYGIGCLCYDEVSETNNWELVSITDSSQISGKGSSGLFYVYVSIDTEEVYTFYYQVDDGGFKRGKVDADVTTIYEKDDCSPHVVEYTTYTKNKMNSILRIFLAFGYGESSQKTYKIYTPTGTILRTFELDSQ